MGRNRKIKVSTIFVDYGDVDGMVHEFKETLRHFGLHVIEDPRNEGIDSTGFIVSNVELTTRELNNVTGAAEGDTPELLNFEF